MIVLWWPCMYSHGPHNQGLNEAVLVHCGMLVFLSEHESPRDLWGSATRPFPTHLLIFLEDCHETVFHFIPGSDESWGFLSCLHSKTTGYKTDYIHHGINCISPFVLQSSGLFVPLFSCGTRGKRIWQLWLLLQFYGSNKLSESNKSSLFLYWTNDQLFLS